jgi:hypothetical protein
VLNDFRTKRAHRRILLRIVPQRHDDGAWNVFAPARERERLAMVAGRRGDDSPALIRLQVRDEIEPSAYLKRARRIVVFMLYGDVETGFACELGMFEQWRRLHCSVHVRSRRTDIVQARFNKRFSNQSVALSLCRNVRRRMGDPSSHIILVGQIEQRIDRRIELFGEDQRQPHGRNEHAVFDCVGRFAGDARSAFVEPPPFADE